MAKAISSSTPEHVGIIMDGNRRWAKQQGLPGHMGHKKGVEATMRIIKAVKNASIHYLSLYVFSTENWKRNATEVGFLMQLLSSKLRKYYSFYRENNIRIVHSGDFNALPKAVQQEIIRVVSETENNTSLTLNLAVNYGGKNEIVRAINRWLESRASEEKQITELQVNEEAITNNLDQPDFPAVDLVIRSAGEFRMSNFLIWESAYAELYSDNTLWPDWEEAHFQQALKYFSQCKRNFGT